MTGTPKHEPVADAKHRLLGHNLKAAAPVETHVPGPVCFQITNALVLVEQLADRRHQLASDSLSLARTIDRRRAQMPVIEPRIMARRSEAHTSELQSLMRISYAVFCLKKKNP